MALREIHSQFRSHDQERNILKARWPIVAAAALAASGAGSDVPELYRMATDGLPLELEKPVQRRLKEAILKTSVLYGIPKSLQALLPLFAALTDEQIDHYGPRYESIGSPSSKIKREEVARKYFDVIWTPDAARENRERNFKYHPDLYFLNLEFIYEWWISEDAILNSVETQMCNAAALICSNCPVQAMWHTRGVVRHGGAMEDARLAQDMGLQVARLYGCKTGEIVSVDDIPFDDTTPH